MSDTAIQNGFKSSLDHLFAELERIKLCMLAGVKRASEYDDDGENNHSSFHSLYRNDIELILSSSFDNTAAAYDITTIHQSLYELESDINRRKQEHQQTGRKLALCELQNLFQLSPFDINVILMCLLPELDARFERYYAYIQDDITQKVPSIGLVLKLLCSDLEETLTAKQAFQADAPMIKNTLVKIYNGHTQNSASLLSSSVCIDERITDYLTGRNQIDRRLRSFTKLCKPRITLEEAVISPELKKRFEQLTARNSELAPVYFFHGTHGAGKKTVAEAVCHESGIPLLLIDAKHMLAVDMPLEQSLSLLFREGRLQNAAIYMDNSDLLLSNDSVDVYTGGKLLFNELHSYPQMSFLSSIDGSQTIHNLRDRLSVAIEFESPEYVARKELWRRQSRNNIPLSNDIDINALADRFRLTAGQIADAYSIARNLAVWRDPEQSIITNNDLYLACRQQSRQRLSTLTRQVGSRYNWDDIVLPRDQKDQLVEICNQVKYSNIVYNEWGFGLKHVRGKGLNVLFSGPSGTGKTMAAEIMGNELGIDMYKIDLSTIVSKYIGETEKNLDRIFREGTTANAIIFFDEADSLFGKRSEVKDAHDRYANIEISYLLQKMEEYEGIIILATNFRKNLDDAFTRRMHFAVEFPIPEEKDRYRIWKSIFPEKVPLGPDLDLSFMARQFSITGGNIKNIALASAFLAAQDGGLVTMPNIIRATRREYQKMGKLCTETDFAEYFSMVKD